MPSEQIHRKQRSIAILAREGVPFIDHLPVIEDEASASARPAEEVAIRAMCLFVVAAKGTVRNAKLTADLVARFAVDQHFTSRERAFVGDQASSDQEHVNFSWRYESLNVLLWALSFVSELKRPDHTTNVDDLVPILMRRPRDTFIADARLRSMADLLDADDLIYRYHWATEDARLKRRQVPGGLNASVVLERVWALNWLIQPDEWDEVDTGT